MDPAEQGTAGGFFWGSVIGLLMLEPLLGIAIGSAVGAAMGSLRDLGIDDDFALELGESLTPGCAALLLLVRGRPHDDVLPRIQGFGGRVLQTTLPAEAEERLRKALRNG